MAKPFVFKLVSDVAEWLAGARETTDSIEEIADELENLDDTDFELDRDFETAGRQARDLSDEISQTGDDLDDLGKSAKDSGDELEDGFERGERAAETLADSAEDSLDDVADAARDAGEEAEEALSDSFEGAGSKLVDEVDRMDAASEGAGDKFSDAWADAISDFDGTIEGGVEAGINSLMGLAGAAGIGGVAGSALIEGITGVVRSLVDKWREGNEEVEQRNREMYQAMLENADAYFSEEQIIERFHQVMNRDEDAPLIGYLDDYLEYTDLTMQEIALAIADPRSEIADQLATALDDSALQMHASGATAAGHAYDEMRGSVQATSDALQSNTEFLESNGIGLESSADVSREWANAQAEAAQAHEEVLGAIEANIEAAGGLSEATLDNNSVLADYADQLIAVQDSAEAAGESSGTLIQLQYEQALAFVEAATAAGLTEGAALDLAVQYGLIPENVATDIEALGVPAAKNLAAEMKASLDNIPSNVQTAIRVAGDLNQANAEVTRIERNLRTITINAGIAAVRGTH